MVSRQRCRNCNKFLSDTKIWQGRKTCDTRCAYERLCKLQSAKAEQEEKEINLSVEINQ